MRHPVEISKWLLLVEQTKKPPFQVAFWRASAIDGTRTRNLVRDRDAL